MKSALKWLIVMLVALAISYLLYKTIIRINTKQALKEAITSLPVFDFQTTDSISYTNANLLHYKYLVLVWFNTDCEHCQYEVQEFGKNPVSFSHTQILMVSGESLSDIRKFGKTYGVDTLGYLKLMNCDYQVFFNTFGTTSVPSLFIYSPEGKLLKQYNGETKFEAITKYLK